MSSWVIEENTLSFSRQTDFRWLYYINSSYDTVVKTYLMGLIWWKILLIECFFQACRCHGYPITNTAGSMKKRSFFCRVTARELGACELIENALMVGDQTVLFMPSFQNFSGLNQRITGPIVFNVIERTNLTSLDEGKHYIDRMPSDIWWVTLDDSVSWMSLDEYKDHIDIMFIVLCCVDSAQGLSRFLGCTMLDMHRDSLNWPGNRRLRQSL